MQDAAAAVTRAALFICDIVKALFESCMRRTNFHGSLPYEDLSVPGLWVIPLQHDELCDCIDDLLRRDCETPHYFAAWRSHAKGSHAYIELSESPYSCHAGSSLWIRSVAHVCIL